MRGRIEVFVKSQKNIIFFFQKKTLGVGGGVGGRGRERSG